jgi:hypothetical protein
MVGLYYIIQEMGIFPMSVANNFCDMPWPKYLDSKTVLIYRSHPVYGPYIRAAYHLLFPVLVRFRAVAKRGVTAVGGGGEGYSCRGGGEGYSCRLNPHRRDLLSLEEPSNTASIILSFSLSSLCTVNNYEFPKKIFCRKIQY